MGPIQRRATRLIRPMLAVAGPLPSPAHDDEWAYELKWDGVRAVAYLGAGPYRLMSRNDLDMAPRYPEIAGLAEAYADTELVLDGELVTLINGKPSFSRLQQRMQVRSPTPDLITAVPVVYFVFDVLHHDGRSMLTRPYRERRQLLDQLNPHGPFWQTPPAWIGGGPDVLVISKKSSSAAGPKDKAAAPAPSAPSYSASPTPTASSATSARSEPASPHPSSATWNAAWLG